MKRHNEGNMKVKIEEFNGKTDGIYNENYDELYGCIDYAGKSVLDLGADIGTTADYFLRKGAGFVLAVDGSKACFEKLLKKASVSLVPMLLYVEGSGDIEGLFKLGYRFDVVKCDIEGGEEHLFQIQDRFFRSVKEYIMEVHSLALLKEFQVQCARNGYDLKVVKKMTPNTKIVYAVKV